MLQNIRSLNLQSKKSLWIVTGLFCAFSFFFLVKILQQNQIYQFEGEKTFRPGDAGGAVYTGISLSPGIYHVELDMEADLDKIAICTIEDGTVFSGGLLTNGEHLYAGMTKTDFDFWLFESTDNLQVVIDYWGEGTLTCGNLTISDTGRLWSMLWVIIAFIAFLVVGFIIFSCYDRQFLISKSKKQVIFFLFVIVLIASFPYLCGYNISGADLTYHLQRIEGVKDGLKSGYFPVRLEPEWLYGYGYANGIFYCNALFYFPALLRLAGFPVTVSYNVYCIVLNIAAAWISWYCFGKIFQDDRIGLACSGLYTLSIARIYKLLIINVVGEGSAFTFIPLVLYGFYRIFTEDIYDKKYKTAWIPVALGFSGLIQTHVLTCEITVLFTIMLLIFMIMKIFRLPTFLELTKGALAALGLCLWYIVPFLDYYITQDVHIKHVSARTIQERGLYFVHLLFYFWKDGDHTPNGSGTQYSPTMGIELVLIIGLFLFFALWFGGLFRKKKDTRFYFIKVISIIGIIFLWMSLNCFPWDWIQSLNAVFASLVSSLQVPYRFLDWGTACLVTVFGYCLWFFKDRTWIFSFMIFGVVIGIATSGFYLINFVNCNKGRFCLYNEESMGFGYISGEEYLIEGTRGDMLTFEKEPKARQDIIVSTYQRGHLSADFYCENASSGESYVDVPLLLYKGYHAYGNGSELKIGYGENNRIRVYIPAQFSGNLEIRFKSPVYWRISEIISLMAAIWIMIQIFTVRRRKQR